MHSQAVGLNSLQHAKQTVSSLAFCSYKQFRRQSNDGRKEPRPTYYLATATWLGITFPSRGGRK